MPIYLQVCVWSADCSGLWTFRKKLLPIERRRCGRF